MWNNLPQSAENRGRDRTLIAVLQRCAAQGRLHSEAEEQILLASGDKL